MAKPPAAAGSKAQNYSVGDGRTAASQYEALTTNQQMALSRARQVAELTIPSLVPPEGYITGQPLYSPYSSLGAKGVNNIASRLMLLSLPPGQPVFRHTPINNETKRLLQAEDPEAWSLVEIGLAEREKQVRLRMEGTPLRDAAFMAMKLLIVAGNCLYQHSELDEPVVHPMDRYVVKRSRDGKPVLTILREAATLATLDAPMQKFVAQLRASKGGEGEQKQPWEDEVTIYTVCKLGMKGRTKVWYSWQEIEDARVPGSDALSPFDSPPLYPLWMIPVYGQDWGRAYADEYYGDLLTADNFSLSLNDGAAAAAWTLFFTKPGSRTRARDLERANNLSVLVGDASDVTTLQSGKAQDMRFVSEHLQTVAVRLAAAFLLNSSVQRPGERVTAEEIRLMAEELEQAMGGVYAILSQTFQRVLVNRFIYLMEQAGELEPLPGDLFAIQIATGTDALGRTYDGKRLDAFMMRVGAAGPPAAAAINVAEFLRRAAVAEGVDPRGLIKDEKQMAQEMQAQKQEAMQADLMAQAAGPAVQALGDAVSSGALPLPGMTNPETQAPPGPQR